MTYSPETQTMLDRLKDDPDAYRVGMTHITEDIRVSTVELLPLPCDGGRRRWETAVLAERYPEIDLNGDNPSEYTKAHSSHEDAVAGHAAMVAKVTAWVDARLGADGPEGGAAA